MRPLLAQLRIELLLARRRGESVLITVVVPIVLLIFFGAVAPPATGSEAPTDFLVPGLLALAVMSTSMVSLGIATAYERYYGALKRLIGSPLPRVSLLAAKTIAILAIEALQVVALSAIAHFAFGWDPSGSVPLAVLALLIGSIAFAGLGLLMAGTLRAEATLAVANGLYLVFLLLGGFVFPIERLPGALGTLSRLLPPAALSDATRAALVGPTDTVGASLAVLLAWAVILAGAAALTFRAE
jgi:ABC-2 type transport system permease protein